MSATHPSVCRSDWCLNPRSCYRLLRSPPVAVPSTGAPHSSQNLGRLGATRHRSSSRREQAAWRTPHRTSRRHGSRGRRLSNAGCSRDPPVVDRRPAFVLHAPTQSQRNYWLPRPGRARVKLSRVVTSPPGLIYPIMRRGERTVPLRGTACFARGIVSAPLLLKKQCGLQLSDHLREMAAGEIGLQTQRLLELGDRI